MRIFETEKQELRVLEAARILSQYDRLQKMFRQDDLEKSLGAGTVNFWRGWCHRVEESIQGLPSGDRKIINYALTGARPVDVSDITSYSIPCVRLQAAAAWNRFYSEFMANFDEYHAWKAAQ